MPMFNSSFWIEKRFNQSKHIRYFSECIIIDDGSGSNSMEIVKEIITTDSRFQLIERPKVKKRTKFLQKL
jgi:hypothetical protein